MISVIVFVSLREKVRDLTQSYDKGPFTIRTWNSKFKRILMAEFAPRELYAPGSDEPFSYLSLVFNSILIIIIE